MPRHLHLHCPLQRTALRVLSKQYQQTKPEPLAKGSNNTTDRLRAGCSSAGAEERTREPEQTDTSALAPLSIPESAKAREASPGRASGHQTRPLGGLPACLGDETLLTGHGKSPQSKHEWRAPAPFTCGGCAQLWVRSSPTSWR